MPTPCRLIHKTGERVTIHLRCPQGHFFRIAGTETDWTAGLVGYKAAHPVLICSDCGEAQKVEAMGRNAVYDTSDGDPHPGDMYWMPDHRNAQGVVECHYWDNCEGEHLHVVLPNGHHWDVDSRASNCTRKEDRAHRCWIRSGEPPRVTAGKSGNTCSAGAGSILSGNYHGFLRDGMLT